MLEGDAVVFLFGFAVSVADGVLVVFEGVVVRVTVGAGDTTLGATVAMTLLSEPEVLPL